MTATALTLSLCSCLNQGSEKNLQKNQTGENGKLFPETTELSIMIGTHPSWPYQEDWLFWKYLQEATNTKLKIQVVPNTEMDTKITLSMADSKSLPDLIHAINKKPVDSFASSGAFIPIDDYVNDMPNYTKFWDSLPKQERDELMMQRVSTDGKTYFPSTYIGKGAVVNDRAWLYRKDIFEKNNLAVPQTMEELYETGLKLKKLYPDSYPVSMRTGFAMLDVTCAQWKPYMTFNAYYDYNDKTWKYGATDPIMKDIVEYWIKMVDAKILPPDFFTMSTKSWEEMMSTNRGFITADYLTRIDFFNSLCRAQNPEYTLAVIQPPKGNAKSGQNKTSRKSFDPTGYLICNTGKEDKILNAVKFVDWMYSDEACNLLSWGKEGESYKTVNGKKQFIIGKDETARQKYGVMTYGLYMRLDPEGLLATSSEEQNKNAQLLGGYIEEELNPINWLSYNKEETIINDEQGFAINEYTKEMLGKFIMRQEPMSKWDSFVKELESLGLQKYLDMLTGAYDRAKSSQTK